MPYTPSTDSAAFQSTLIAYLADIGITAVATGLQRALFDALVAGGLAESNTIAPAEIIGVNPFVVTDEAVLVATTNAAISLPLCDDTNNGRIVLIMVGPNGSTIAPQGGNIIRDPGAVALANPYSMPPNSLWIFSFIASNVWHAAGVVLGPGGAGHLDGGTKSADFNAVAGFAYQIDLAAAAGDVTVTMPAAAASNAWSGCRFAVISTQVGIDFINNDTILGPGQSVSALGTVWDVTSTGAVWVTS